MSWTKEGRAIAAICWIAVGVIFLMFNFELIRPELIAQLWKLWPLIPIAVGVGTLISVGYRPWSTARDN